MGIQSCSFNLKLRLVSSYSQTHLNLTMKNLNIRKYPYKQEYLHILTELYPEDNL